MAHNTPRMAHNTPRMAHSTPRMAHSTLLVMHKFSAAQFSGSVNVSVNKLYIQIICVVYRKL